MTKEECDNLGWGEVDFVYVCGDAYVDHPSFGAAIICRVLEAAGYRIAFLAQPDWHSDNDFMRFGRPRLGFLVSGGNVDSMVAHYTAAKKRRNYDYYSPGGKIGLRPDRAVIVYCNCIRRAYGDVPIIIGGLEASLRRFAHYDYWDDRVRNSILVDSGADILSYGMGEHSIARIAKLLAKGVPVKKIRDVRGTAYLCSIDDEAKVNYDVGGIFDSDIIKSDKSEYAKAFLIQYKNQDAITGKALVERYKDRSLVVNPPDFPLEREELDRVYELPYAYAYHPSYESAGGVPALQEVRFSITHNRGCFGECAFCAIAYNQGRSVRSRSIESCVREAEKMTKLPLFKGYISDVGGPSADFRHPSCEKQLKLGCCDAKRCLSPEPCPNLTVDHGDYIALIRAIEAVPGVKKVYVRSGIRFDYVMMDKKYGDAFMKKIVADNISGQLRVAPEHICRDVLALMGKPEISVYNEFQKRFRTLTKEAGKEQYVLPYLISSHPGCTLDDAIELAVYMNARHLDSEQVQDFYPTPGSASTCMYYTGIDPFTGKAIHVPSIEEKKMQRALLRFRDPKNADLVRAALRLSGRTDLIGHDGRCLVDYPERKAKSRFSGTKTSKKTR